MNDEKQKKGTRPVVVMGIVFCALCVLGLILIFHNFVFVIQGISVENNAKSNAEQIIRSSGITLGSPMYSINKHEIYEKIKAENPYVESVLVKRDLPSGIRIIVSESEVSCYTVVQDEVFLLSGSLRALEQIEDAEHARDMGACRIILPKLSTMILGEKITLTSSADPSYMSDVIEAVEASKLSGRIDVISLKNKFGIYAVCDGLYRIEFGSSEDISLKLEVAYAIIESGKLDSTMVSVIDVSDPSEGAVISDKTQVLIPDDK